MIRRKRSINPIIPLTSLKNALDAANIKEFANEIIEVIVFDAFDWQW